MSRTRRRLLGLLTATALAVAVVPLAALGTTGVDAVEFTERAPAGMLTLETRATKKGAELKLTHTGPDGTVLSDPDPVQVTNKCVLPTGELELLGISVTGGDVGLVSHGLGSSDGKNCNTDNGRITGEEMLRLEVLIPGVVVDYAVLDVEGKFGADLAVATSLSTADEPTPLDDQALSSGSDNGADAGGSDNKPVTIGALPEPGADLGSAADDFAVIELGIGGDDLLGAVSLEGGGDYEQANPLVTGTVFHLVSRTDYEFALGCNGDTITGGELDAVDVNGARLDGSFGLDGSSSGAQGYLVTRYDTSVDNPDCDPIGADLSSEGPAALFRKTLTDAAGDPESPRIRLTLQWRVPADHVDLEGELARMIDLDPLGEASNPQPVEYCVANNDVDGELRRATSPDDIPWCLLHERIEVRDGYLIQTHVYDGAGDPRFF